MLVRFFAAACAAAGVEEEDHPMPEGTSLETLLAAVLAVHRPEPPAGTAPLPRILQRCSFLRNQVALRDPTAGLGTSDIIDVLPPFAGG